MSFFGADYSTYWSDRITRSSDGTRVPDVACARQVLERLGAASLMPPSPRAGVDVGSSAGRMLPVLQALVPVAIALDIDPSVLPAARSAGYAHAVAGSALALPFAGTSVDLVFCWASSDVLVLQAALTEFNRVLRVGGLCVITGKNANYCADDARAREAESAARAKGFPGRFARMDRFEPASGVLGFAVAGLATFERRGDFGEMRVLGDGAASADAQYYEFAALLQKMAGCGAAGGQDLSMDGAASLRWGDR